MCHFLPWPPINRHAKYDAARFTLSPGEESVTVQTHTHGGRPPSWIFKSSKFYLLILFGEGGKMHQHAKLCAVILDFYKFKSLPSHPIRRPIIKLYHMRIGQPVAEICPILNFSRWQPS